MTIQNNLRIRPFPLGAHVEEGAIRFSFVLDKFSSDKRECGILIYDKKTGKRISKIPFGAQERLGHVYCKFVTGFDPESITYQFYEGDTPIPDRCGRMYVMKSAYGREHKERDIRAEIPRDDFDWEGDKCPRIPYSDSICYCMHVRGFTKHKSSGVAHRGTFLGMTEKLDYLKEIGVTTVELQPAYEFDEIPTPEERMRLLGAQNMASVAQTANMEELVPKRCNYWGYKWGYYYAPKSAYAAGDDAVTEFKEMVKQFHLKGIEIVMQFYFPGEVKMFEILPILRFWVQEYHVDGFHIMGENLPADMIASDAVLADTKMWYYHFNAEAIYGRNIYPEWKNLAVCQDDFLYTMRKFLKGDEDMLGGVMAQMRAIPEKIGRIHYLSNYYGFTLMDMVSYDRKHNEDNGEDNRDGNNYNCSWNCGEEGTSRRKKIVSLRHRQVKNAMLMLLFAQSTPMIFMGDEFGNSQKGNNNPYCQDNAVTWLNWNDAQKNEDLLAFWKQLVTLRKQHPILRPEREQKGIDYISCGYPDISYHGQNAWRPETESYNRHIGIMYCGKYAKIEREKEDQFFYLAMNMYWDERELALPKLPKGWKWEMVCGTSGEDGADVSADGVIRVPERSVLVYTSVPDGTAEHPDAKKGGRRKTAEDYSDRTAF